MEEQMCRACGKVKKIQSYYKNAKYSSGFDSSCKVCRRDGVKVYKTNDGEGISTKKRNKPEGCDFTGMAKVDWQKLYKFLNEIGYDIHGDIHAQFCKKHNLPYKERPKQNTISFTPNDFLD